MKKRFLFKFRPLIYILAGIIIAMLLGVIVYNSMVLAGALGLESSNFGLDLAAIIFAILVITIVCVFLFASGYYLKDDYLLYMLGFLPCKVLYKDIVVIREEKSTRTMVINYMKAGNDNESEDSILLNGIVVNIGDKWKDTLVESIRSKNSAVLYELIDKHLEDDE